MNQTIMQQTTCSRWGIFEVSIVGPKDGNPFTEQKVTGIFKGDNETVSCDGFYDGDGVYRIRFMPSFEGAYTYQIQTTFGGDCTGNFTVTAPKENAHGPVRVASGKKVWRRSGSMPGISLQSGKHRHIFPTTESRRPCGDIRYSLPSTPRQPAAGNAFGSGISCSPGGN